MIRISVVITIVCMLASVSWTAQKPQENTELSQTYLSPQAMVLDAQAKRLYVAGATSARIAVVDLTSQTVAREISLPEVAGGLALSTDGSKLYVTTAVAEGKVYVVDVAAGRSKLVAEVGHTPVCPVLSADGKQLYVCSQFNNTVTVVDLDSQTVSHTIPVVREPVAADLTPNGQMLLVANHLPQGPSDQEHVAASISLIDTRTHEVAATLGLPNGSMALRDLCVSGDGKYAYVTHILARHHLPTTQIERGWINTNALSIIDIARQQWLNTVLLDDVDRGAANPWAVACTPDDSHLVVTLAGTAELCVIDRQALHTKLDQVAAGENVSVVASTPDEVRNDLSFLVGLKRRVKLPGHGPRAVAVLGSQAFVAEYFNDSVAVLDLGDQQHPQVTSISLQKPQRITAVRRGEMLFNDAEMCFQQWQSCASCHPGSGRSDGLNWDLLNDGIGNPKNTKSLLLAHSTPPAMSLGIRDDARVAVRSGIRYIQFAVRPEADAAAIDVYLQSLKPVASPYLVGGQLSASARRGQNVFAQAGCARCHHGPFYTDQKSYDVGTGIGRHEGQPFDTPTLVEAWRTGPYLHDGRAVTIEEMLTRYNPNDKHGHTSDLTPEQIQDLVQYVLTR